MLHQPDDEHNYILLFCLIGFCTHFSFWFVDIFVISDLYILVEMLTVIADRMAHIPWTLMIFSGLVAYMAYTMFSLYSMFNPPKCSGSVGVCVKSYLTKDPKLVVSIFYYCLPILCDFYLVAIYF